MFTRLPLPQTVIGGGLAALLALSLVGCATTAPTGTFTQRLPKEHIVEKNDNVSVKVEASQGVSIADYEKQRLSQKIKEKIDIQKLNNAGSGDAGNYEIEVLLTRYDKGNAFARAMLAGLGQIHIDAHVSQTVLPERKKVSEFDIDKTFAWGGIYGGVTSIEDVELGFADGIAETLTKAN